LHSIQTPWSTYLAALTALSLSRDPLTDVCWAIPELDAIRFTALEKTDGVSIHEGQLEQVQNDTVPLAFRREERCQIADVLYVHTTAQLKNDLAVFFPGDPEHLSLFGVAARHADRRSIWQFRVQLETIDFVEVGLRTDYEFS
jgi:hypothetical protein